MPYKVIIFSNNFKPKKYRLKKGLNGLPGIHNYIKNMDPGYKYMNVYNDRREYVKRIYSTDTI